MPWASALAPLVPCGVVVGYIVLSETIGATLCLMLSMLLLFCLRGVRPIPALLTAISIRPHRAAIRSIIDWH